MAAGKPTLLWATALERSAAALVTHDRDFSRLAGLRVLMGETRH